jgi:hypothetical protein
MFVKLVFYQFLLSNKNLYKIKVFLQNTPFYRGRRARDRTYGSWIYNYLYNQCLSPLMLWVQIPIRERWTTLCDIACQWLATGQWFTPGSPFFSTQKNWLPRYNWNIFESGVKHHKTPNPILHMQYHSMYNVYTT